MVKLHNKKSENYFRNMVKCCRNVNLEENDTEISKGKLMNFDYCENNLRTISKKLLLCQC